MWLAPNRGEIVWPIYSYASYLGISAERARDVIIELLETGTADGEFMKDAKGECDEKCETPHDYGHTVSNCQETVRLINRRMTTDEKKRENNRIDQYKSRVRKKSAKRKEGVSKKSGSILHTSEVRRHISEEDKKKGRTPLPPWLDEKLWEDFKTFRKTSRRRLTARAEELAVAKLSQLRAAGQDPRAVIEQSILNGWQGLFPLKANGAGAVPQEPRDLRTPTEKLAARKSGGV